MAVRSAEGADGERRVKDCWDLSGRRAFLAGDGFQGFDCFVCLVNDLVSASPLVYCGGATVSFRTFGF